MSYNLPPFDAPEGKIAGDLEVGGEIRAAGGIQADIEQFGPPNEQTLSGAKVIAAEDPVVQVLNGGVSDRNVTLPAADAGTIFFIVNSGTSNKLVVKNAAAATIGNVGPNQTGIVISGETAWSFLLMLGGTTALAATIANLNAVPTATGTGAEIDAQTKDVMSSGSTWTLSASLATQTATFQAKDADGNNIAAIQHVRVYLATLVTGGVLAAAAFSTVAPTTGTILKNHTAKLDWDLLTDASGTMVLSINNTGGTDHYAVFAIAVLPNGKLKASAVTDVRAS